MQTQCGPSGKRAQDAAIKKKENTKQTVDSITWIKTVKFVGLLGVSKKKKALHLEKHPGGLKIT